MKMSSVKVAAFTVIFEDKWIVEFSEFVIIKKLRRVDPMYLYM